jgi:hypothetical protein
MLKLYSGITPNLNKECFYYSDFSTFLNVLEPYFVGNIEDKNYIPETNGIIRLNGEYADISYVVDTTNSQQPYCYWVRNISFVSGYYVLTVEHDYFAEYIHKTNFGLMNVLRGKFSNIVGIDDTQFTSTIQPTYSQIYDGITAYQDLKIVFVAEYSVAQTTLFTNESLTQLGLFSINTPLANLIDTTGDVFGAIKQVQGIKNIKIGGSDYACAVIKIWILPNDFIDTTFGIEKQFKSNNIDSNGNLIDLVITATELIPNLKTLDISFNTEFGKKYAFGTKTNAIDLITNSTNIVNLNIQIYTQSDGIQVFIRQGNNVKEVTECFEIFTTTNNGTLTRQQQIAHGIKNITNVTGGFVATINGLVQGNISSTIGGISSTANNINNIFEQPQGHASNLGGDGFSTWAQQFRVGSSEIGETIPDIINTKPFFVITYSPLSIQQESEVGYKYNFDSLYSDLQREIDFIQANLPYIQGIPVNAIEAIQNKFNQGINLKVV